MQLHLVIQTFVTAALVLGTIFIAVNGHVSYDRPQDQPSVFITSMR